MNDVVTIYKAKTNFSQLVKKAQSGQNVYIGAYGQPTVMLVPYVPSVTPRRFGILKDKYKDVDVSLEALNESDKYIAKLFEDSANAPFPG
jgi:prevent-host-death family protein